MGFRLLHLLAYVALLAGVLAAADPYAPVKAKCANGLNRIADGISSEEARFVAQRSEIAAPALDSYLKKTGQTFPSLTTAQYPIIGLSTSGGGSRSLLTSAGLHKG